jgi:hypothetical protein
LRLGHDIRLRDPEFVHPEPDEPSSRVRGHSGYYEDRVFDKVVADAADEIIAWEREEAAQNSQTAPDAEVGETLELGAAPVAAAPGAGGWRTRWSRLWRSR